MAMPVRDARRDQYSPERQRLRLRLRRQPVQLASERTLALAAAGHWHDNLRLPGDTVTGNACRCDYIHGWTVTRMDIEAALLDIARL